MKKHRITDYIYEQSFIDWVLNTDAKNDAFWQDYLSNNPEEKKKVLLAKELILKLQAQDYTPPPEIKENVWENINKHLEPPFRRKFFEWRYVAAAVAIFILLGVSILYKFLPNDQEFVDYKSIQKIENTKGQVKLILSDETEKFLSTSSPQLEYYSDGTLIIDSVFTIKETAHKNKNNSLNLNQLIVPKGKRSTLLLSDGSKVFLNSGSRIIYPTQFNKEYREIFVEGEAFMIVSHNDKLPFYVVTDDLKVRVLGTQFNVRAYPDDANSSVVLVSGSVQTIIKSEKYLLKENELLLFDKNNGNIDRKEINVLEYIGWKDGWLYCNEEKIESVTKKLSRYYDVTIEFTSEAAKKATIIGKLDLKTECSKVMEVVGFTASVKVEENNGNFIISEKQ